MTQTWSQRLRARATEIGHSICLGLDPDLRRIPLVAGSVRETLANFLRAILEGLLDAELAPAAVKPNLAFFEQYGIDGLQALGEVLAFVRRCGIPVVLDAKRGDIGPTQGAYARAVFDFWHADAVTIAPYLGRDAIEPMIERAGPARGVYLLVRTSNPSASDLQDQILAEGEPLYQHVARWVHERFPGLGAVVGATDTSALRQLAPILEGHPLLIPGIGTQGGRVEEVLAALSPAAREISLLNASSSVLYAYQRERRGDVVPAAVDAMRRLVDDAQRHVG
ncbi:MAG: orotidine-5'-phosphate decarboxylase [Myxococcales bacterium]|nr:orotidine-5'-phosphate decarboxylase [Myxococcales bacterium]